MADSATYTAPEADAGKTPDRADAEDVTRYVTWYEAAEEATLTERTDAERDRDYYDNKQLTADEIATLKRRKQPVIIVNRIKRKIDFLRGVETQQRSDPKAFPRTPAEEQGAEAATDSLRYVADANQFDVIRSQVWENLLIEGLGGVEVVVEEKPVKRQAMMAATAMSPAVDYEIKLRLIEWDRFFRDPHARKPDFSDGRYMGLVAWMDFERAVDLFPQKRDILESTLSAAASVAQTYDDRPKFTVWADSNRRRVRIVYLWHRERDGWHYCTFTKGGKLESGISPYEDEDGKPDCPMIMQSAYIDRENRRYGVVREMIGPQDEVNKRRSKALHLMSVRQTFGTKAAVDDVDRAKRELAKPDGHLEVTHGEFGKDFGILPTGDLATAQFQLLQEAKAEIDLLGPNASMQGKSPQEQSGRAIIAQQQGGYVELGPMLDRLRQWNIRVYKAIWCRIRQFWTQERWIRVTDDERNVRFVGLNRRTTLGEQAMEEAQKKKLPPEQLQALAQQLATDRRAQQPVMANRVTEMDVDIIVDDAPDSVTIQHEQFQLIVELMKTGIPLPPDVVIEASQLRNKDQLLEKMKAAQEAAAQAGAPADPVAQAKVAVEQGKLQLTAAKTEAEIENTRSSTLLNMVKAGATQGGAQLAAANALVDAMSGAHQQAHDQQMDRAQFAHQVEQADTQNEMAREQAAQQAAAQ